MSDNLNLHKHVWLPRDGAARTVVALHGTGGDENDLVPLVREIYPDANILGLRGNVNEGGALRFFRAKAVRLVDIAGFVGTTAYHAGVRPPWRARRLCHPV